MALKSLHSILVKSILIDNKLYTKSSSLYIPFWLNLYETHGIVGFICDKLYIPFWLNLYDVPDADWKYFVAFTFHSG